MPFFLRVRIACVLRFIVTLLPSTMKVFFCRFGFHTRLTWRIEKLTWFPNCLPLPVSSHLDAIAVSLLIIYNSSNSTSFNLLGQ